MIVMKFGGTSVGDAAAIRRTADIVRGKLANKPIVVVSAPAFTTHSTAVSGGNGTGTRCPQSPIPSSDSSSTINAPACWRFAAVHFVK